ncbi:hypothetical protein [Paenibacillus planticolens]|uniref:Uncharacterized protein n=1 Tax=Paenibacillus planticolens TaxID=2654976 RepID=A0ABX1ZS93_9BACL|nr:hypothetical protein [Paenibacillus planticolens]NOV01500.1 hypothetical protein [Paenibacillus planticolens]
MELLVNFIVKNTKGIFNSFWEVGFDEDNINFNEYRFRGQFLAVQRKLSIGGKWFTRFALEVFLPVEVCREHRRPLLHNEAIPKDSQSLIYLLKLELLNTNTFGLKSALAEAFTCKCGYQLSVDKNLIRFPIRDKNIVRFREIDANKDRFFSRCLNEGDE